MTDQCYASEIRVGDVINGPDGKSTVVGISSIPWINCTNLLRFDFAEGSGNRCWSGLSPTERITRVERTAFTVPFGFVVGNDNQVILSGVFGVVDMGESIEVHHFSRRPLDMEVTSFHKKTINRVMGEFTYTLNPAR